MIVHDIDNNRLILHPSYLGLYQDEYEIQELYQDINSFLGLEPKQQNAESMVHVTHAIINRWKNISDGISERGIGVVGLLFLDILKIDGETCNKKWVFFFIRFVTFASNYV